MKSKQTLRRVCQRFLWVIPKPVAIPLDELHQVDREFSTAIGKKAALCVLVRISLHSTLGMIYDYTSFMSNASMIHTVGLMSSLWTLNCSIRKWVLQQPFEIFRQKHKSILQQITTVSCMDNLLCGEYNSELVINDVAKDAKKMKMECVIGPSKCKIKFLPFYIHNFHVQKCIHCERILAIASHSPKGLGKW